MTTSYKCGLIFLAWSACGPMDLPPQAMAPQVYPEATPAQETLASDHDLENITLSSWIDVMPGVHNLGGPRAHLEATFEAPSKGCTEASHFRAQLVARSGKQVLVLKRLQPDRCSGPVSLTPVSLRVTGVYKPEVALIYNNVETPVSHRVIY